MKRIAVFNDTSSSGHYGCCVVMKTLVDELRLRNVEPVFFWPVGYDWRPSRRWIKKQNLSGIIVNGEGSIHDSSSLERAKYLCELATFCRYSLKIPSVLINSTLYKLDSFAFSHLKNYDLIYVRESNSFNYVKENGLDCSLVPDLSFFSLPLLVKSSQVDKLLITDSVFPEATTLLMNYAKVYNHMYAPMEMKKSMKKLIFDHLFFRSFIAHNLAKKSVITSSGYHSFIKKIVHSCGVVTGRFHAVTLCLVNKRPVFAIESNTPKISSVLIDVFGEDSRVEKLLGVQLDARLQRLPKLKGLSNGEILKIESYISNGVTKKDEMFDMIVSIM